MEHGKRSGRWRSGQESRRRILDAARTSFARNGYDRSSVRAIATEAGVDQAMVFYFFGTKQGLFAESMRLASTFTEDLDALFAGPIDDFGVRLVSVFLAALDNTDDLDPMFTLTRSAPTHDTSASMLREFLDREIGERIAALLGGPDARLRTSLIVAQLLGLVVAKYIVDLKPLSDVDKDEIVVHYGAAIQSLVENTG